MPALHVKCHTKRKVSANCTWLCTGQTCSSTGQHLVLQHAKVYTAAHHSSVARPWLHTVAVSLCSRWARVPVQGRAELAAGLARACGPHMPRDLRRGMIHKLLLQAHTMTALTCALQTLNAHRDGPDVRPPNPKCTQ